MEQGGVLGRRRWRCSRRCGWSSSSRAPAGWSWGCCGGEEEQRLWGRRRWWCFWWEEQEGLCGRAQGPAERSDWSRRCRRSAERAPEQTAGLCESETGNRKSAALRGRRHGNVPVDTRTCGGGGDVGTRTCGGGGWGLGDGRGDKSSTPESWSPAPEPRAPLKEVRASRNTSACLLRSSGPSSHRRARSSPGTTCGGPHRSTFIPCVGDHHSVSEGQVCRYLVQCDALGGGQQLVVQRWCRSRSRSSTLEELRSSVCGGEQDEEEAARL